MSARWVCGIAVVLIVLAVRPAAAQWPYVGGSCYPPPWLSYRAHEMPYFALHPPVYYSLPVARTYGYSPFAYPPGVMTPEIAAEGGPLEIINPHVTPKADKPANGDETGPAFPKKTIGPKQQRPSEDRSARVRVILNPHVVNFDTNDSPALAQAE